MPLFPTPKLVKIYSATFTGVGGPNESLRLTWTYPDGMLNERSFLVGTQCFLESPVNVSDVPDEQLLASLGMSAILAGEVLPGTVEWLAAVSAQETKNFQTIVGEVRLKPPTASFVNPQPVDDLNIGPPGTVFDVTFQKGTGTNIKVVRTDAWSISQYGNRVDSGDHASYCVPGAVHKEFGFKKSDLGEAESANRNAVTNWINGRAFWV